MLLQEDVGAWIEIIDTDIDDLLVGHKVPAFVLLVADDEYRVLGCDSLTVLGPVNGGTNQLHVGRSAQLMTR